MNTLRRIPGLASLCAVTFLLCGAAAGAAAPPDGAENGTATNDAPELAPQEDFFSSVKQAFKEDFEREVVRGHFDVGPPPDTRRYYCLVDAESGRSQPNGVAGETVSRKDGMTGIKGNAVSLFSCASAQHQGMLVTTGYVLHGAASRMSVPATPAPGQPAPTHVDTATPKESPPSLADGAAGRIDVAGVRLGMSVDEVRAVLRSKKLRDYHEWTESLGHEEPPVKSAAPVPSGRFINVVAAWTMPPTVALGGGAAGEGESYEVMFTPVPGKERAMAIVHATVYAPTSTVRESVLNNALVKKYGGYAVSSELPASPTWRMQSDGSMQVGDPCKRRGTVDAGGPKIGQGGSASRPNLALTTTSDEFQFQIDHCGVAIVSEDHSTANGAVSKEDRLISRFTVTSYSPSIGLQGATAAAQWLQSAADGSTDAGASRSLESAPNL